MLSLCPVFLPWEQRLFDKALSLDKVFVLWRQKVLIKHSHLTKCLCFDYRKGWHGTLTWQSVCALQAERGDMALSLDKVFVPWGQKGVIWHYHLTKCLCFEDRKGWYGTLTWQSVCALRTERGDMALSLDKVFVLWGPKGVIWHSHLTKCLCFEDRKGWYGAITWQSVCALRTERGDMALSLDKVFVLWGPKGVMCHYHLTKCFYFGDRKWWYGTLTWQSVCALETGSASITFSLRLVFLFWRQKVLRYHSHFTLFGEGGGCVFRTVLI